MGMARSLLKGEGSTDHTGGGHDAKSYLLRPVVKYQSSIPFFARLEHPNRPGSRATEEGYDLFATSENLNLLERQAQGSKDMSVIENTLPPL